MNSKHYIILAIIAVVLRLPGLFDSFWLDEAAQALESIRPLSQQLKIVDDFQPPLLHLMIHLAQYIGVAEWWLRVVGALVPGVLTVLLTYHIGKKIVSVKYGLVAAFLLVTSSFHIFYSQELRPYSLSAVFAAFTWMLLLTKPVLDTKTKILFILATGAGLYSTYLYPFVFISQVLFQFFQTKQKRVDFVWMILAPFLLFLPWLPSFLDQLKAGQLLRADLPGWEQVVSTPQLKALPLTFAKFFYGVINIDLSVAYMILPVSISVLLVIAYVFSRRKKITLDTRYVFGLSCWIIGSIGAAWLLSFWVPVLQPKRVIFALPAFYLLLSYFFVPLFASSDKIMRRLSCGAICILFAVNLWGTWQYFVDPQLRREDWRGMLARIEQKYPKESSVAIFAFTNAYAPVRWYSPDYPTIITGTLTTTNDATVSQRLSNVTTYENVVIFDYLRALTDPEDVLSKTTLENGFVETSLFDSPGVGFVRGYSRNIE